jgi:hypothetical protein
VIKTPITNKSADKKDNWALLKIGIIVIISALIALFFINAYFEEKKKEAKSNCRRMEYDALNTLAAISSYFAIPEHTNLPTYDQLVEAENLVTTFPVKIDGDPEKDIIVTVIGDGECPKGNKYVVSFEGINEWRN